MKKRSVAEATQLLRTRPSDVTGWVAAFRSLPHVDAQVLTAASLYFVGRDWYRFARSAGGLPAEVIRGMLAAFDRGAATTEFSLLARALLPRDGSDGELQLAWRSLLTRFLKLNATAAFGSKLKTQSLQALAADPAMVEALRAVAVGIEPSISVLGVLAIEGSVESVDALMTTFAKVTASGHGLEWFAQLAKVAAKTPQMAALLAAVRPQK